MRLLTVSTGSAANCYLLTAENGETLILDAGVSFKKLLPHIGDISKVQACLVTHEHGDHARAAHEIARRGIKTFMSSGTANALIAQNNNLQGLFHRVKPQRIIYVGDWAIVPFLTQHDCAEPLGFLIKYFPTGEQIVYATDTYYLKYKFPNTHYWIIECNYCDDIALKQLDDGDIGKSMRDRLLQSHMSLNRLVECLTANDLIQTAKIVLVHLSDSRSDEKRMIERITEVTGVETVAATAGQTEDLNLTPF